MINYVKGDATYPQGEGKKFLVHVTNDAGGWGAGFVLTLDKRWIEPKKYYAEVWQHGFLTLGVVQYIPVEEDLMVVNMCAQRGFRFLKDGIPLQYDVLEKCLTEVFERAVKEGCSIHGPKFGSGLAGGDWKKIEEMLLKLQEQHNVPVTIYEID